MDAGDTIFEDRNTAGRALAEKLQTFAAEKLLVLALPRGGVPIGLEVAKALNAPLDTLVARKLGAPTQPEFGFGAVAPGDVIMLDQEAITSLGLTEKDIEPVLERELIEMGNRVVKYRSGEWSRKAVPETVIVVDDGLATGVTARAALESARINFQPKKLVFATPVCALGADRLLQDYADEIVCLLQPDHLQAVGQWYQNFDQVSDEAVLAGLQEANSA